MNSAYARVAETRPRIRRDLLFTKTPDGVLFHNSQGGFRLNGRSAYRLSTLLVPHLNGDNQVARLCADLPEAQREMIGELICALYERDFARDVTPDTDDADTLDAAVADRFAAQIAYIDHYTDAPRRRFAEFRHTRVAVLGDGPVARWCVASLIRNGVATVGVQPAIDQPENAFAEVTAEARELTEARCPARIGTLPAGETLSWADLDGYDVVVVAGGAGAPGQILELRRAGVPEGRILVPAWVFGTRAIVGPRMGPDSTGCWVCALLRLGANGDTGAAADIWRTIALAGGGAPAAMPTGPLAAMLDSPLAAMLGNLLGYEIFRIRTGALPAETDGKVIIQNLASLDVIAERLLPHPRCPYCPDPGHDPGPVADLDLDAAAPEISIEDAAEAILAELNARMPLIQPHTGVFSRFDDDEWTQTPIKASTVELFPAHGRRRVSAFDVHHVAGARRRTLHRAATIHAEHVARVPGRAVGASDHERMIDPARLVTASGVPISARQLAAWTDATSLTSADTVLVPVAAVQPFGPHNQRQAFIRSRAGAGAGATLTEAIGDALGSAFAYAALRRAIRGTARVRRVLLDTLGGDPELTFLVKSAHNLGLEKLELCDLAPDGTRLPILVARTLDPAGGGWLWSAHAHPSWPIAAVAAIRDLLGRVQLGQQTPDGEPIDDGDPLLGDFDAGTLLVTDELPARLDTRTSWAAAIEELPGRGADALVVVTTPPDLAIGGIQTTRVLLTDQDG